MQALLVSPGAFPQILHLQHLRPTCDVVLVERVGTHGENTSNISKLSFGLAFLCPLELGQNRILCGGDVEGRSEQLNGLPAAKLLKAEGTGLPYDKVDFSARR